MSRRNPHNSKRRKEDVSHGLSTGVILLQFRSVTDISIEVVAAVVGDDKTTRQGGLILQKHA